jgi:16S rRNA (cytidine1402-2'-O)-methyltransferase
MRNSGFNAANISFIRYNDSMGTLYIVSTPIGNLDDITIRAIHILFFVDIIACEDTRRTGLLLQALKKRFQTLISADHTQQNLLRLDNQRESRRVPEIIQELIRGKSVALVSDAGTPMLSDPGYLLVHECRKRDIHIVPIPGPSAVLSALVASGLPANHILFLGFPPEKQAARIKLFTDLLLLKTAVRAVHPTVIFYCAPHKLMESLRDLDSIFPLIHITVARELTKMHETVWVGPVHHALKNESLAKGEITILFTLSSNIPQA